MLDIYSKVKHSIDMGAGERYSSVVVANRTMMGSNGHMTVGIPFNSEQEYAVNAELLGKALSVLTNPVVSIERVTLAPDKDGIAYSADKVTFKNKRSRSKLQSSDLRKVFFTVPRTDLVKTEIPADFSSKLKMIMPFIGDDHINLWQVGAISFNGRLYATTGKYMVGIDCDLKNNFTIPARAVAYVLKREERVTHYAFEDNYIVMYFEDGTWLKITRLADERAESCKKLFDMAYVDPTFEVHQELRDALNQAIEVAGDEIQISPEGVWTYKDSSDFFSECDTKVKTTTAWTPDLLKQVLQIATFIDFDVVPPPESFPGDKNKAPASFKGPMAQGLLQRRELACIRKIS